MRPSQRRRGPRALLALAALALAGWGPWAPARASLMTAVNGVADVAKVWAEVDDIEQETLRQQYTANVDRTLTEYLDFRASFRYFRFDLDETRAFGSFREEIQPSVELSWSHPWFRMLGTALRREVRTPFTEGELVTESLLVDWRTTSTRWPLLNLRYDWQQIESSAQQNFSDTRRSALLGSLTWNREHETFQYTLTREWNENLVRDLEGHQTAHLFRYAGLHDLDAARRWRLDSQYVYGRRSRTDEVRSGQTILEPVQVWQGLFAVDASPEVGELEPVPSLVDGNTAVAVEPTIDVGATAIDVNVGLDLGFSRPVSAVFLYTDRAADNTAAWSVYVSSDNLTWTLHTGGPATRFDPRLNRFEIEFPTVDARYVKVVKRAGQSVASVLVTEAQVFEALEGVEEIKRDFSSHLADVRLQWLATDHLDLALNGSLRVEPGQGTVGDRTDYSYGFRGRYARSPLWTHIARWEQSFQVFEDDLEDLSDVVASYTLLYEPLPALSASASANTRATYERGGRIQEFHSALVEANGSPLRTVTLSTEGVVGRSNDLVGGTQTDTWSVRSTADARVTRRMGLFLNWYHQQYLTDPEDRLRVRRTYGTGANLQLTDAIYARAGLNWIEEERFYRSQSYLLSWRMGPRLTVSSQVSLDDASDDFRSDRWVVNGTLELSTSASAYLTYSNSELSTGAGRSIEAWQLGMRVGF